MNEEELDLLLERIDLFERRLIEIEEKSRAPAHDINSARKEKKKKTST